MSRLKEYAELYYNLGFNITCISKQKSNYNYNANDIMKVPYYAWKHLSVQRQNKIEFNSFDWSMAVGIGSVAGFEHLCAIDIDGCSNISFVNEVLDILNLPLTYEWVTKSGSNNGFHIIIRANKFFELAKEDVVSTYFPKIQYISFFEKIELLWNTHIILPPSKHSSGGMYQFLNCLFPESKPAFIDARTLIKLIDSVVEKEDVIIGEMYDEEIDTEEDNAIIEEVFPEGVNSIVVFEKIRENIIQCIRLAKKSIYVAVTWFTDGYIIRELVSKQKEQIDIKILFYDDKKNDKSLFQLLYDNGAKIRCPKKLMHNKFCVIDKKVLINGSYNWTRNAHMNNEENIIITYDKELVEEFISKFDELFEKVMSSENYFKTTEEQFYDYLNCQQPPKQYPCFLKIEHVYTATEFVLFRSQVDFINYYTKKSRFTEYRTACQDIYFDSFSNVVGNLIDENNYIYIYSGNILVKETNCNLIYLLDSSGKIITEKVSINRHLGNGFYGIYNEHYIYNNKLQKIHMDFFQILVADSVDENHIYVKIKQNHYANQFNFDLWGLCDLSGKIVLQPIYHKIEKINNEIHCTEYPILFKAQYHAKDIDSSLPLHCRIKQIIKYKTKPVCVRDNTPYITHIYTSYGTLMRTIGHYNSQYYYLSETNGCLIGSYLYAFFSMNIDLRYLDCEILDKVKRHMKFRIYDKNAREEFKSKLLEEIKYSSEKEKRDQKEIQSTEKELKANQNCYIATLVYGDINHYKVSILRQYRDCYLKNTLLGRYFIKFYYKHSPYWVEKLRNKKYINNFIKALLDLMINQILKKNKKLSKEDFVK